jgi:hypothetical protein
VSHHIDGGEQRDYEKLPDLPLVDHMTMPGPQFQSAGAALTFIIPSLEKPRVLMSMNHAEGCKRGRRTRTKVRLDALVGTGVAWNENAVKRLAA